MHARTHARTHTPHYWAYGRAQKQTCEQHDDVTGFLLLQQPTVVLLAPFPPFMNNTVFLSDKGATSDLS